MDKDMVHFQQKTAPTREEKRCGAPRRAILTRERRRQSYTTVSGNYTSQVLNSLSAKLNFLQFHRFAPAKCCCKYLGPRSTSTPETRVLFPTHPTLSGGRLTRHYLSTSIVLDWLKYSDGSEFGWIFDFTKPRPLTRTAHAQD